MKMRKSEISLTILTEPVGTIKNDARLWIKQKILHRKWGGHAAVTRSLIEGLEKIGFTDYNYNPYSENDIGERVHVLAGVKTLQYAIQLKRKGKIKFLSAGPNVVIFADDYDDIISSSEIDLYLQPSQWACEFHFKRNEKLMGRCFAWPAGIDLNSLNPCKFEKKCKKVLLYHKDESDQFAFRVEHMLSQRGYDVIYMKYGSYKFEEYIKALGEVEFAVFISRQESQGLCLSEAWAMNVLTLCFDPHCYRYYRSDCVWDYFGSSTAPYLTEATGAEWFELSELESLLDRIDDIKKNAYPRKWIKEHMSDEVCAEKFLQLIGIDYPGVS